MQLEHVSLANIVPNPWRDLGLYPMDPDHIRELSRSIDDHGFFGGIKGRRRNGKVELGCGHSRIEAAKLAGLKSVPVYLDELDDDEMLRLMTDENATQAGSHPGAVINEVAAVTRRLIEGLLGGTIVQPSIQQAFNGDKTLAEAIGKLRNGTDVHLALGRNVIRRYLGQGDEKRSHRGERDITEAITVLKQSGRYDTIVEETVLRFPPPLPKGTKPAKDTAVATTKSREKRKPIYDERAVNVFPNTHQAQAFRESVTTRGAQKVIPVDKQLELAQQIMSDKQHSQWDKKQAGAPYIRKMVETTVQEGLKIQRDINEEEREQYLFEQREARIDDELLSANASVRSLLSATARLQDLAQEFPFHPKILGFADRLSLLSKAIQRFNEKLGQRPATADMNGEAN